MFLLFDKYSEANLSKDLEFKIVRIFDSDPTIKWPPRQVNLEVGGYPIERIPYVAAERTRPFFTDKMLQVTWYVVYGSIHDQKNTIVYEMIPYVMKAMKVDYGQILWVPCPMNYVEADYKQDCLEVIDCLEKVEEFNVRYRTRFRMGFAKMWLPIGDGFTKERVYLSNLNACIDMIVFHYAQCQVLNLGNFTTSTDRKKYNQQIDISGYENLLFADTEYFEKVGVQANRLLPEDSKAENKEAVWRRRS